MPNMSENANHLDTDRRTGNLEHYVRISGKWMGKIADVNMHNLMAGFTAGMDKMGAKDLMVSNA